MSANAEIIAELRRVLNERDEAREQLDLTKRELGRWVDREAKAVRERDEARERLAGLPAWQHACEQSRLDLAEAEAVIARRDTQLDEARAEVERWKRSCNVFRERDWPHAFQATVASLERELADANEQLSNLRKLSKPWEGDAYRRGAEAMRARCEELVKHNSHEDGIGMGSQRIESAIRALTISEEP